MAARPNTLRTLEYGQNLARNQAARIDDMLSMAASVLETNKTLTPQDIAGYKACMSVGRKHVTLFYKIANMPLPMPMAEVPRKRGRPSRGDLETLARARGEKVGKAGRAAAAEPVVAVKRRGRPPKNAAAAVAAETAAPPAKRRGRPPKVKQGDTDKSNTATVSLNAPVRVARKPKPAAPAINTIGINDGSASVKRGPGRPKGSKNKPKVVNGHNGQAEHSEETVAA